jgi:signal transduction histidine kinase
MAAVTRTLASGATYRRLGFVLSALVLGHVWFVVLVAGWSVCLALLITPLVIPALIGLAAVTRVFARVEAGVARGLLDAEIVPPPFPRWGDGVWRFVRAMLGGAFWRAQGYLLLRWLVGVPLAALVLGLLLAALAMIVAPAWIPFVHGGAHLGFWRPHTFAQSLALVPVGLLLLPAAVLFASALAAAFAPLATALLSPERAPHGEEPAVTAAGPRRTSDLHALYIHAAVDACVLFALIVIWAITSRGYFWPVWVALPLAAALGVHGWFTLLAERPALLRRFRGSRSLARTAGVFAVFELFFIAIWAITGAGYFWPVWPLLGMAIALAAQAAPLLLSSSRQAELAERIETLESSRAGAVDVQDSELRRIERDLHDGAQARLVSLGMSLGMAEHTLAEDPERAGQLLAEARVGAEQALRELRDLARGIHPPVLSDRGLEAAIAALAASTPMQVAVSARLEQRPPAVVESAAYFVAAEALANAAKHAHASHVQVHAARVGDTLELEVYDDGAGGADPAGSGLLGLKRRVEALDGKFALSSPPGGPTRVRAELPCS